jgi:hypothetical protein
MEANSHDVVASCFDSSIEFSKVLKLLDLSIVLVVLDLYSTSTAIVFSHCCFNFWLMG